MASQRAVSGPYLRGVSRLPTAMARDNAPTEKVDASSAERNNARPAPPLPDGWRENPHRPYDEQTAINARLEAQAPPRRRIVEHLVPLPHPTETRIATPAPKPTPARVGHSLFGDSFTNLQRVRVPHRLLGQFARNLGTLYNSGVPLGRAMELMTDQPESLEFGLVIASISRDLNNGVSLEKSFATYPNIFDRTWRALMRRAMEDGSLGETLLTLADMYQRNEELRARVKASCTYPLIVFGMSVLVSIVAFAFLLPQILGLIASSGHQLPILTQILIFIFNIGTHPLLIIEIPIIVYANVYMFRRFIDSERGRIYFDCLRINLPIVGPLAKKIAIARLMHSLRATLSRGVRVTLALDLAGAACGNSVYQLHMLRCVQALRDGDRLAMMFKTSSRLYDPMVFYSMYLGEESGTLDRMIDSLTQYYELEVSTALGNLLTVLEPILILATGLLVAGVVLAIFTPLYSMVGQLGGGI